MNFLSMNNTYTGDIVQVNQNDSFHMSVYETSFLIALGTKRLSQAFFQTSLSLTKMGMFCMSSHVAIGEHQVTVCHITKIVSAHSRNGGTLTGKRL